MFEGFNPTPKSIEIIRDYLSGEISIGQLIRLTKEKAYA
jgi:putative transcriptional regulator